MAGGPEPAAGPVRGPAVEGGAEDDRARPGQGGRVVEVGLRDPEEGHRWAEHDGAGHRRHAPGDILRGPRPGASERTSAGVERPPAPRAERGSAAVRSGSGTSRRTRRPTASHIRRTCAVAALVEDDTDDARRRPPRPWPARSARRRAHPLAQGPQRARGSGGRSSSTRYSLSTPWEGWATAMGEVAVVGEDEQPLGREVEPPDREDPGLGRDEAGDGRSARGRRRRP